MTEPRMPISLVERFETGAARMAETGVRVEIMAAGLDEMKLQLREIHASIQGPDGLIVRVGAIETARARVSRGRSWWLKQTWRLAVSVLVGWVIILLKNK